jgi:curved DNA-binding protein CbpA
MDADNLNYYRILQVQPDAPYEVIRHNYTILLQKLRMHPDLGGNNRDAALINVAYETLQHPEKRAEYDRLLLSRNNLLTVSQRRLNHPSSFFGKPQQVSAPTKEKNQRNYYRILQVHPDANATIIRERYIFLSKKSELPHDLLDEAYLVLNNPEKRIEYDRLLKRYKHAIAVKKMDTENEHNSKDILPGNDSFTLKETYSPNDLKGNTISLIYQPVITQYCEFCKTPHLSKRDYDHEALCQVCQSPLFFQNKDMPGKLSRSLDRIKRSENIIFYVYWPGQKLPGRLFDISPKGLRFNTEFGIDIGRIIKIEAEKFRAVAEVIHSREKDNKSSVGVCFRTVLFDSPKGNFLWTSV